MKAFFETWYFLIIMLSLATIGVFVWLYLNRKTLNAKWWEVLIVSVLHTLVGVAFVKLFALIEVGFNASIAGSVSLFGGIFFMPLFYALYAIIKKLDVKKVFDVFANALVITYVFARANCLYSGCCLGIQIGTTDILFPVREAEMLFHVLFVILTSMRTLKGELNGNGYAIYIAGYGLFRFVFEFLRQSASTSIMHIAHVWSLVAIVLGVGYLVFSYVKSRKEVAA